MSDGRKPHLINSFFWTYHSTRVLVVLREPKSLAGFSSLSVSSSSLPTPRLLLKVMVILDARQLRSSDEVNLEETSCSLKWHIFRRVPLSLTQVNQVLPLMQQVPVFF